MVFRKVRMGRAILAILSVASAVISPGQGLCQESSADLLNVRHAWEGRESTFNSFRATWSQKTFLSRDSRNSFARLGQSHSSKDKKRPELDELTYDETVSITVSGTNVLYSRDGALPAPSQPAGVLRQVKTSAYDGHLNRDIDLPNEVRAFPQGLMRTTFPGYRDIAVRPIFVALRPLNTSLVGINIDGLSKGNPATVDGHDCITFEAETPKTSDLTRYFVCPDFDWSITRIQMLSKDAHLQNQTDIQYKQAPSGEWIPRSWSFTKFDGASRAIANMISANIDSFERLATVPIETFQPQFPVGTWVSDIRSRPEKDFIVKEDGQQRAITAAELRGGATYEQLAATSAGHAITQTKWWTKWVIIGNVIVVVVLSVLVAWRRARLGHIV
jgi:hypothetical protein